MTISERIFKLMDERGISQLDFSKAKVKRPSKNFTRYGITKMLINDGVWSLDNKKTESSIRLVYELFNKKLAEELEKRKPKIEK